MTSDRIGGNNGAFLTVDDQRWFYRVDGEGPAILWLHGFTGSHRSWEEITPQFSPHFQCVSVDILGHGDSDAPSDGERYRMDMVVSSLHRLMGELGHTSYACVGYSMGGRTGLSLAVRYPHAVHKLVAESASPGLEVQAERVGRQMADDQLADRIESQGTEAFVAEWEQHALFATQTRCTEARLTLQRDIRLRQRAVGLAGSLRGMGTGAQASLWTKLQDVEIPVLLITGEQDEKFTGISQRMVGELQKGMHRLVRQAGHAVHMEQPTEYIRMVKEFLLGSLDKRIPGKA